jgi:Holliday junction resolvase RusA-like endonuclease
VKTIELRVAGQASTKSRPRFDPRTRRTYTPPSNIISENDVRAVWREAGEPRFEDLGDGVALELEVTIYVVRPGGHYRRNGSLSAAGLRQPVPCRQKPDLDNALKLVMDALSTRAYRDDVRIATLSAARRWGPWPETIIRLTAWPAVAADGQLALAAS